MRWHPVVALALVAWSVHAPAMAQNSDTSIPGQWDYQHGQYDRAALKFQGTVDELEGSGIADYTYSAALNRLGQALFLGQRLDESEQVFRKQEINDACLYGPTSNQVADDLYNQLRSLRRMGRFTEAQPLMERVLTIRRKTLGEDHRSVGNSWLDIALNYQRLGRNSEAENAFLKGIAVREKLNDPSQALLPGALRQYGDWLRQVGRTADADAACQRAADLQAPK